VAARKESVCNRRHTVARSRAVGADDVLNYLQMPLLRRTSTRPRLPRARAEILCDDWAERFEEVEGEAVAVSDVRLSR
jgi:hypothetical protein